MFGLEMILFLLFSMLISFSKMAFSHLMINSTKGANSNGNADEFTYGSAMKV